MPQKQQWVPLAAGRFYWPPPVGTLMPHGHAVWRIDAVRDDPEDRGKALADLTWMGGRRPATPGKTGFELSAEKGAAGYVYPGTTWPACSCCVEPMPCRKELQAEADKEDAELRARAHTPDVCLACGGPFKPRQRVVTYPGENLLVPGAPAARFHAAEPRPGRFAVDGPTSPCREAALAYERQWQAVDPLRPELAARAYCPGNLLVHLDGYTVCRGDLRRRLGVQSARLAAPGCMGEMTHRHSGDSRYCNGNCGRPACADAAREAQRSGGRVPQPVIWRPRQRWTLEDYQRWELRTAPLPEPEGDTLL
jgi:hypothetical protein